MSPAFRLIVQWNIGNADNIIRALWLVQIVLGPDAIWTGTRKGFAQQDFQISDVLFGPLHFSG